jgi:HK97 family phage major capsid protein
MTINELREKRMTTIKACRQFLDSHRTERGTLTVEDDATYSRMEQEITDLGKEIARLERQEALDAELSKPLSNPLTSRPFSAPMDKKNFRAMDEYKSSFWNAMRSKYLRPEVVDALQIGTDTEGGYLVP